MQSLQCRLGLAVCLMWFMSGAPSRASEPNDPPAGGTLAGERPRVVSSDIGGSDPDDKQSFAQD